MTTVRLASKLGLKQLKVWEGNLRDKTGKTFYQLQTNTIEGKPFYLHALDNKVVLVSNVAARCNWAKSNLDKLSELELKYRGQLQILLFPSDDFGTEQSSVTEFQNFAKSFGPRFHLMEKTKVNGSQAHAVFAALKAATNSENVDIDGNYETKFLVAREGQHVERFSNARDPDELVPFIDRLIGETEPHDEARSEESTIKSPASYVNTG